MEFPFSSYTRNVSSCPSDQALRMNKTAETSTTKPFPAVEGQTPVPSCRGCRPARPGISEPEKLSTLTAAVFTSLEQRQPQGEWRRDPTDPDLGGSPSRERDLTYILAVGWFSR